MLAQHRPQPTSDWGGVLHCYMERCVNHLECLAEEHLALRTRGYGLEEG